jgi:hypothetical protein
MNIRLGDWQGKYFCVHHNAQIGCVSHSAYKMGTGVLSLGVKRLERGTDHTSPPSTEVNIEFKFIPLYIFMDSSPASAEVKKMWIYTATPPYAFMA